MDGTTMSSTAIVSTPVGEVEVAPQSSNDTTVASHIREDVRKFFHDVKEGSEIGYLLMNGSGGIFKVAQRKSSPGRYGTVTLVLDREVEGKVKRHELDLRSQGALIVAIGVNKR